MENFEPMVDDRIMVYKICTENEWRQLLESGVFFGSPDDLRDGFIHLSGPGQVARTSAKFFAGRADLILLTVNPDRLGGALRWEASGGGTLFPHLYAPLPLEAVVASEPLRLGPDGRHILPAEFA